MINIEARLAIAGIDQPIDIYEYHGREAISELFHFDLLIVCKGGELCPDEIVGSGATLTFAVGGRDVRHLSGQLTECVDLLETEPDYTSYRVRLQPRMSRSELVTLIDIYMDLNIVELVKHKLDLVGLSGSDVDLNRLEQQYPKREFVVQYQETDGAFLSRQTEHWGISYFFEQSGQDRDVIVLADSNDAFRPYDGEDGKALFTPRGEVSDIPAVSALTARTRTIPSQYILRDYNYRSPQVDLTAQASLEGAGAGAVYEYGDHFKTTEEGQYLASVRAEERFAEKLVYEGKSDIAGLRAGATMTVLDHLRVTEPLLLTKVEHRGTGGWGHGKQAEHKYENSFTAIPARVLYRPPRRTPKPTVKGFLTGRIESESGGDYAEVDEHGRYRVRFLFDAVGAGERQASKAVRMMQPHAGPGYGMHFPLRNGIEVLIAFVGGDPDRPIIAGTAPNPLTASPVVADNATRNIIRTGGGNEINIDDADGSQRIKLSTPHKSTVLQLGAPNQHENGAILETKGAVTSIATESINSIGSVQTAFSQIADLLLSRCVISEAGKQGLWDFITTGKGLYDAGVELGSSIVALELAELDRSEMEKAQRAHETSEAAKLAQEACRKCRRLADTKAQGITDQDVKNAIAAYEEACDADDGAYLTALGTLEDRNGIILANRAGTNPNFLPVMYRDAYGADSLAAYDYDKFVAIMDAEDEAAWKDLSDEEQTQLGPKDDWQKRQRARWDPHWDADANASAPPTPKDTKTDKNSKYSDLITLLEAKGADDPDSPLYDYYAQLVSCNEKPAAGDWSSPPTSEQIDKVREKLKKGEAVSGCCALLDEIRGQAINDNEAYAKKMNDNSGERRRLRWNQQNLDAAKAAGAGAGAIISVITQILAAIGQLKQKKALRGRWDEALEYLAKAKPRTAKLRDEYTAKQAYEAWEEMLDKRTKKWLIPFTTSCLHHIGSDHETSISGETLTLEAEAVLVKAGVKKHGDLFLIADDGAHLCATEVVEVASGDKVAVSGKVLDFLASDADDRSTEVGGPGTFNVNATKCITFQAGAPAKPEEVDKSILLNADTNVQIKSKKEILAETVDLAVRTDENIALISKTTKAGNGIFIGLQDGPSITIDKKGIVLDGGEKTVLELMANGVTLKYGNTAVELKDDRAVLKFDATKALKITSSEVTLGFSTNKVSVTGVGIEQKGKMVQHG